MSPGPVVRAPRTRAEDVKNALVKANLLDAGRRFDRRGGYVLMPVQDRARAEAVAARHGAEVVDADVPARETLPTPYEVMRGRLADAPAAVREAAPRKWERLGDVVVARFRDVPEDWRTRVAGALAHALGVRCVVEDAAGVEGELREMADARILWGEDPVTEHVENGVRFRFDASRLMFASGNVHERTDAARTPCRGEVVADMFAGVGYFTLPIAVHAGPARVVAMEKNPASHRFLAENVRLNGVEHVVDPWLGDNRDYPHHGFADRVLMGYFPGTAAFLPKAFDLLKPEGGVIQYHDAVERDRWQEDLTAPVRAAAEARGHECTFTDVRVIKSYNPSHVHALAIAEIR